MECDSPTELVLAGRLARMGRTFTNRFYFYFDANDHLLAIQNCWLDYVRYRRQILAALQAEYPQGETVLNTFTTTIQQRKTRSFVQVFRVETADTVIFTDASSTYFVEKDFSGQRRDVDICCP